MAINCAGQDNSSLSYCRKLLYLEFLVVMGFFVCFIYHQVGRKVQPLSWDGPQLTQNCVAFGQTAGSQHREILISHRGNQILQQILTHPPEDVAPWSSGATPWSQESLHGFTKLSRKGIKHTGRGKEKDDEEKETAEEGEQSFIRCIE